MKEISKWRTVCYSYYSVFSAVFLCLRHSYYSEFSAMLMRRVGRAEQTGEMLTCGLVRRGVGQF